MCLLGIMTLGLIFIFGLCPNILILSGSLNLLFCAGFVKSYFSLSFYPINMEFGHHIPRVVGRCAMIFLSHPAWTSGFIQDFLDHYTLEWQKAVSAYL